MTADLVSSAQRLYVGCRQPGDREAVQALLDDRYGIDIAPVKPKDAAFWLLSIHAHESAFTLYKDLDDFFDETREWPRYPENYEGTKSP